MALQSSPMATPEGIARAASLALSRLQPWVTNVGLGRTLPIRFIKHICWRLFNGGWRPIYYLKLIKLPTDLAGAQPQCRQR